MTKRFIVALMLAGAITLAPVPTDLMAQMGMPSDFQEHTVQTTSYAVKIRIGPEVSMPAATMTVTDQGMPVNRHLEVHIFDKRTGVEVKDPIPTVNLTDQTTGTSRLLANITAWLLSRHRDREPHFGDNLYLTNGMYTITVVVGDETAVLKDVLLTAT